MPLAPGTRGLRELSGEAELAPGVLLDGSFHGFLAVPRGGPDPPGMKQWRVEVSALLSWGGMTTFGFTGQNRVEPRGPERGKGQW